MASKKQNLPRSLDLGTRTPSNWELEPGTRFAPTSPRLFFVPMVERSKDRFLPLYVIIEVGELYPRVVSNEELQEIPGAGYYRKRLNMTEFPYEVGDTFEGGPIYLGKFISQILGVGGEFDYDGNTVTLTYLPWDYKKVEAVAEAEAPSVPEPVVEAIPEPVAETSEPAVEVISEPVAETPEEEIAIAPEPKSKITGRPRKVVSSAAEAE